MTQRGKELGLAPSLMVSSALKKVVVLSLQERGVIINKFDLLLGANPSFASSTCCLPIPKPIITNSHPRAVRPINTGAICNRERLVAVKS